MTARHAGGRPRSAVDPVRVAKLHGGWRSGRISMGRAAQMLGISRDVLRWRWADYDPDLALWRDRKLEQNRKAAR